MLFQETNIEVPCSPLRLACCRWKGKEKKASGFLWTHYRPGAAHWTLCSAHPWDDFWLFLCFLVWFCVLGKWFWVTQLKHLVSLHCIVAFKGLISKTIGKTDPECGRACRSTAAENPNRDTWKFTSASRSRAAACCSFFFLCRCLCISAILIFSPCTDLTDSNWITRCRLDLDSTMQAADFVGL